MKPDSPDLPARWPGPPPEAGDCPALRCEDGTTLMPPAVAAARLDLREANIDTGIFVDGGDGFTIADNWIRFAGHGLLTRQASGTVDGNLLGTVSKSNSDLNQGALGNHFGAVIAGGSASEAVEVWITNNVVAENGFSGIACTGDRATIAPSLGTPPPHAPGKLRVHVVGNTFLRNGGLGLSFVPFENHFSLSAGDQPSSLVGEVRDNSFVHNRYGFVVHTPIGALGRA